jgi:hypothetical protein
VNHHLEGVADLEEPRIDGERQLAERKDAFGFTADVDQQFVLVLLNDRAGENLSLVEDL